MSSRIFDYINPVALSIGPLEIRWYALAYILGMVLGTWLLSVLARRHYTMNLGRKFYDDFFLYVILGIVLGGRIGYVLLYQFSYYVMYPTRILMIWHGGMSFHGGVFGVGVALYLLSRKYTLPFWRLTDLVACTAPIGIFLGRIANFINGELYGRVTEMPWGIVFPNSDGMPRHPSQLYEASLEGIVLFIIMLFIIRIPAVKDRDGLMTAIAALLYSTFRFVVEFFREPDAQLGAVLGFLSMGQIISLLLVIMAVVLFGLKWQKE